MTLRVPLALTVRVEQIREGKNVARLDGELHGLESLADVIDAAGWVDPLVLRRVVTCRLCTALDSPVGVACTAHGRDVCPQCDGSRCECCFEIIGGYRRFRSIQILRKRGRGPDVVSAQVFPEDVSTKELAYVAVLENAHRENPSLYQKMLALRALRFDYGQSIGMISARLKMNVHYVEKMIALPERLHPAILADLRSDRRAAIGFDSLVDLSKLPHDRQFEAWQARKELSAEKRALTREPNRLRRRYEVERALKQARRHKNEEAVRVLEWALKLRDEL